LICDKGDVDAKHQPKGRHPKKASVARTATEAAPHALARRVAECLARFKAFGLCLHHTPPSHRTMACTHAQLAEGGAGSRGRLHRLRYLQLLEVSLRSQAEPHCIMRPPLICILYAHGHPIPERREQAILSLPACRNPGSMSHKHPGQPSGCLATTCTSAGPEFTPCAEVHHR